MGAGTGGKNLSYLSALLAAVVAYSAGVEDKATSLYNKLKSKGTIFASVGDLEVVAYANKKREVLALEIFESLPGSTVIVMQDNYPFTSLDRVLSCDYRLWDRKKCHSLPLSQEAKEMYKELLDISSGLLAEKPLPTNKLIIKNYRKLNKK